MLVCSSCIYFRDISLQDWNSRISSTIKHPDINCRFPFTGRLLRKCTASKTTNSGNINHSQRMNCTKRIKSFDSLYLCLGTSCANKSNSIIICFYSNISFVYSANLHESAYFIICMAGYWMKDKFNASSVPIGLKSHHFLIIGQNIN